MKSFVVPGALLALVSLACSSATSPGEPSDEHTDAARAPMPATDAMAIADAGPPASDAGAPTGDAIAADSPPPPAANVARCGAGPYQLVKLAARNPMAAADQRNLAGVRITFEHCPGISVVTGGDGKAQVNLTVGIDTWIRFDADGFVPWLCGELRTSAALGAQEMTANMLGEELISSFLTSYKPDQPLIYVQVQAGRTDAPTACRTRDNVVITVKDHPEATILYRQEGSNAPYTKGAWTTKEGVAIVGGLPATLGSVEIVTLKKGCTYVASYGDANAPGLVPISSAPLQQGALTYQVFNPQR
jgi:hypothetical protein